MGTRSEKSKFGQIVVGWPRLVGRRVKIYGNLDHTVFPGVPYLICSIHEFCSCFLLHPVDSLYKALTTHMLAPSPHSHRHLLRGSWLFMCNGDHSIENVRGSGAGGGRERGGRRGGRPSIIISRLALPDDQEWEEGEG